MILCFVCFTIFVVSTIDSEKFRNYVISHKTDVQTYVIYNIAVWTSYGNLTLKTTFMVRPAQLSTLVYHLFVCNQDIMSTNLNKGYLMDVYDLTTTSYFKQLLNNVVFYR